MKPMIILPPDAMSEDHMKLLRENDICVVVAKEPALVKFVDPIPTQSSRTEIENAAIKMSRKLLNGDLVGQDYKRNIASLYIDCLIHGTPLDPNPSQQEKEREAYNFARIDEMAKLARQEAKAERDALKSQKGKVSK